MAARYREVPYWWYVGILTFAVVLGVIVTTTQSITMPVWSYFIALLVGAFVAPFVSTSYAQGIAGHSANNVIVDYPLLSIRKRYCDQQLDEDRGWSRSTWTTIGQPLLLRLVAQCHLAEFEHGQ